MSESALRGKVVRDLKNYDARAVENSVGPGTPDVNCTLGWVELKVLDGWKRGCDEKPVLLDHYVPAQRIWHKRRWRKGGSVWVLLRIGRLEYFLFDGHTAGCHLGKISRPIMKEMCVRYWNKGYKLEELVECLKRN